MRSPGARGAALPQLLTRDFPLQRLDTGQSFAQSLTPREWRADGRLKTPPTEQQLAKTKVKTPPKLTSPRPRYPSQHSLTPRAVTSPSTDLHQRRDGLYSPGAELLQAPPQEQQQRQPRGAVARSTQQLADSSAMSTYRQRASDQCMATGTSFFADSMGRQGPPVPGCLATAVQLLPESMGAVTDALDAGCGPDDAEERLVGGAFPPLVYAAAQVILSVSFWCWCCCGCCCCSCCSRRGRCCCSSHLRKPQGKSGTVTLLLDKNCDVGARATNGDTALHVAVRENKPIVIKLLLARGADAHARNANGDR